MALLASGTYLEDKNMAVMNPMGGGIDTDVQNRMMQLRNDPNALGQQAQKSGDILDLIAARRAADLVAEQKKMLALQMNGSPATVKDQVEKELIDGQKAEMRGPLQSLQDKTQGVAGVLQNQQRQQQQQGRGQPQGQPMRAAMGGIINAPAPNLNRMYNGGIVGYAEGGLTGDEVAAYLKEVGVSQEEYDNATPRVRARIIEGINKRIAEDRDLGTARGKGSLNLFGGTTQSDAQMEDRNRGATESIASRFRSDSTGEELKKGREEFNPTERQDAAERLMNLPDVRGGNPGGLDIGTREQPTPLKDDIYGRLPTMMPEGAMGITPGGDYSPTGKFGNTEGTDAQTGLTFAETQEALENNNKLDTFSDELTAIGKTKAEAEAAALGAKAVTETETPDVTNPALKQLAAGTTEAFDPYAGGTTTGSTPPVEKGIASVVPNASSTLGPTLVEKNAAVLAGQKPPANGGKELSLVEKNAAVLDAKEKPLTRTQEIQKEIDALDEKEGVFDRILNRVADTKFQKSYGGTSEALASGLRDIAETGQRKKAEKRKSLVGQLATETSIEAADVAAGRDRDKFDITEGRLSNKMSIDDKNTVADIALRANTAQNESLARLAKINLDTVNADGAQEYRMAALKLQEQANTIREQGNTNAVQKVVQGYVNSATNFYKGLLANAMTPEAEAAIKQELQNEISRIVGIVGPDGVLDLKALQRTSVGATAAIADEAKAILGGS